jgi:hypothetical protein
MLKYSLYSELEECEGAVSPWRMVAASISTITKRAKGIRSSRGLSSNTIIKHQLYVEGTVVEIVGYFPYCLSCEINQKPQAIHAGSP